MKLLVATFIIFGAALGTMTIDFGSENKETDWYVINDGVMGGLSRSNVSYTADSFVFKGEVSLQNNGGFSSLRSEFSSFDLSNFKTVELRYRATGYNFALNLATSKVWYRPVYRTPIVATDGQWQTKVFNLLDFQEVVVGKATGSSLSSDKLKDIIRLGFITNEKRAGQFLLEVDYIRFK